MFEHKEKLQYIELVTRIGAARENLLRNRNYSFAAHAPTDMANLFIVVLSFLETVAVEFYNKEDLDVQLFDGPIQLISELSKTIEDSQLDNLPWQMIPSFQKWAEGLLPRTMVYIFPIWEYNFVIRSFDLKKQLLGILQPLLIKYRKKNSVARDIRTVLEKDNVNFIGLPILEKGNIILYPILGHELGHSISNPFIDEILQSDSLRLFRQKIRRKIQKNDDFDLLNYQKTNEEVTRLTEMAFNAWKKGMEELLSDAVGVMLFGPSALFATTWFALQDGNLGGYSK